MSEREGGGGGGLGQKWTARSGRSTNRLLLPRPGKVVHDQI